jgi:Fe-S cluster assembly protein SufB
MARFAPINANPTAVPQLDETYHHGQATSTTNYAYLSAAGLDDHVVEEISAQKKEPAWMLQIRKKAYARFLQMKLPPWGADLSALDFSSIRYYLKPLEHASQSWADVPDDIKNTFERIGVPQAEREMLAGVKMQYDSEVIYGSLKAQWEKQGVIFLSMDEAVQKYPDLVREYYGTVIPYGDNMFAALNTAVWSGGSFVYVPPGVEVAMPLQTYFRINAANAGQFERTLIIVDEGAKVHYVEGCTAPSFAAAALHAAVVEIVIKAGGRCQYTTIQNWYKTVYNLVTKRASVDTEGHMIWTDCNLGSKVTMKYPSYILKGAGAKGETLSLAVAGSGQHQDTGSKAIHLAPHTSSTIISKSISKGGGRASYRGLVHIGPNAHGSKNKVVCDALILDSLSHSDTYPTERVFTNDAQLEHEATVSRIGEEQLFYLMSRGMKEEEAAGMIVRGFAEPLIKKLPLEYAIEMNRLIDLEMEGSIG